MRQHITRGADYTFFEAEKESGRSFVFADLGHGGNSGVDTIGRIERTDAETDTSQRKHLQVPVRQRCAMQSGPDRDAVIAVQDGTDIFGHHITNIGHENGQPVVPS